MAAGDFIPEIWSAQMLKNWDEQFKIRPLLNTQYEGEIKSAGDTVKCFVYGDITVNTYSGTVTYETPAEANYTLSIDQQDYWAFNVDDILKVQAKPELRNGYTQRAMVAQKRAVEQFVLGSTITAGIGNTLAAKTTAGDFAALDESNIYTILNRCRRLLEDDNTWVENNMWMTIPPEVAEHIRNSTELTHATAMADEFIRSGSIGKLAGWNLVPVSAGNLQGAGTDGNPYKLVGANRDCIHFAEQIVETEALRRETTFATGVRGLMVYGGTVFTPNTNCGVVLSAEIG